MAAINPQIMNWQRIARRLLKDMVKLRRENKALRERVQYEMAEVHRLASLSGHGLTAKKYQDAFWNRLKTGK